MNEKRIEVIANRKHTSNDGTDKTVRGIHFQPRTIGTQPAEITVDWVDFRSNAFVARLRPGDVIESANLRPVGSIEDLKSIVEHAESGTLLLLVRRRNGRRYIAIDCREKEPEPTQLPVDE